MEFDSKINEYPRDIQALAKHNQIIQGNPENTKLPLIYNKEKGNFNWDESIEGAEFWGLIVDDNNYQEALKLLEDDYYIQYFGHDNTVNLITKENTLTLPRNDDTFVIVGEYRAQLNKEGYKRLMFKYSNTYV